MFRIPARRWFIALLYFAWFATAFAAPSAPAGLNAASLTATSFNLRWSAATGGSGGIVGYDIFRDGSLVGSTAGTVRTFAVTGLSPVSSYTVSVTARDGSGAVSPSSAPLVVTTPADTTVPSRPTDLAATAITTSSCTLNWSASTDNVGVTGYTIYRSGVSLGTSSGTTFDVTGLNPDSNRSLTVRAVDAVGNLSAASVALSVRTLAMPPSVPTGLASSNLKATSFALIWAAATGGTGGIASYDVYQNGTLIGSSVSGRTFAVSGLAPLTTYLMTVISRDTTGNVSPASVALEVTTPADTTAPTRPADLAASNVTTTSFALTWTGSTDNVGVTGYNLYRSGVQLGTSAGNSFEVTGLIPDSTNNITVRAVDAAGNLSAASAALSVRMVALPPSTPTGLTIAALRPSSFTLQWSASTGGTGGIKGYEVYLNGILVGSPTTRSLALSGLAPQTSYSMTVASHDSVGNVSEPSVPLVVSTPADTTKPTIPKGLSADQVNPTSFTLIWTASTDNVGVVGYEVYRNNLLIGSTPTPAFLVSGLAPATLSSMRVKAKDAAGNISGFSAILPVTTSALPNVPPNITLDSPADNSAFTLPFTLTLSATAADSDGTIAKVEFFDNGSYLGETTAPVSGQPGIWLLTLSSPLSAGFHSLTARATDNRNATADSNAVVITVNNPNSSPSITITVPPDGTGLVAPGFVTLTADATDSDGVITKVEFYEGGNLLGTVLTPTASPSTFAFPLTLFSTGTYTLTAVATDNSSAQSISAPVVVNVNSGAAALPYVANFEPAEGYRTGPLAGQLSWVATGGVTVAPSATPGSQQELAIAAAQPAEILSHDFFAPGISPVFVDFHARPVAGASPDSAMIFSTPAAQVALVGTNSPADLWIFGGAGLGWLPSGQAIATDGDGRTTEWIRLTTREDYLQKKWDLYLNGRMISADVPFADANAASLTDFSVNGHATSASAFDSFNAGPKNPLFADENRDGIDDAWEAEHLLSLDTDNRQLSPAGNGVTVLQAYLAGTDPRDFYNGTTPTLTIVSGNNQTAAPSQFNAQPLVVLVTNSSGAPLANAPVTFNVTTGGGLLSSATTSGPLSSTLSLRASSDGTVQAYYQQSSTPGAASQITVTGGAAQVSFDTLSTSANGDTDGNGLLDAWEIQHFGVVGVDADADPDGDGLTNLQESQQGSDPLNFYNGSTPILSIESGNNLYGYSGQFNPRPFQVAVSTVDGSPLPNAPVVFAVDSGGGLIAANLGVEPTETIVLRADGGGMAEVYYRQPTSAGVASQIQVTAGSAEIRFKTISLSPATIQTSGFAFEIQEGFVAGAIDGQSGWKTRWGEAQVTSENGATSGAQVASISPHSALAYHLPSPISGLGNVEFYARPVAGSSGYSATQYIVGDVGVVLVLTSEIEAEINTFRFNDYAGANSFVATGVKVSVGLEGRSDWLHFSFRLNSFVPSWDLYLDNQLVSSNCRKDSHTAGEIQVINPSEVTALLDQLTFSDTPDPNADNDMNNLADAWEMQNFGHLGVDPDADSDNDGIVNLQEFRNGIDPNIFDSSATDSIRFISQAASFWKPTPGVVSYPRSYHGFLGQPYQNVPIEKYDLYEQLGSSSGSFTKLKIELKPALSPEVIYSAADDERFGMYWYILIEAIGALEEEPTGLLEDIYDVKIQADKLSFKYLTLDDELKTTEVELTATLMDPPVPSVGPEIPGGSSVGSWKLENPTAEIDSGYVSSISTYQLEIPKGWEGTVTWLIVFTPFGDDANKVYTQKSWTIDGTLSPKFTLDPSTLKGGINGTYEVMLYQSNLAVDGNRDGFIDSRTITKTAGANLDLSTAEKPFRFWINDDDDGIVDSSVNLSPVYTYTEIEENDIDVEKSHAPDNGDDLIDGKRDLEDLARLRIAIGELRQLVHLGETQDGEIKLGLRWKIESSTPAEERNPSIRLFLSPDALGTNRYLFDERVASAQILSNGVAQFGRAIGVLDAYQAKPLVLPDALFTYAALDIQLLFEGVTRGRGELQLVVLKRNQGVFEEIGLWPNVHLELKRANQLCHRWTCGDGDSTPPEALRSDLGFAWLPTAASSLPDEERDLLLYVHGYNMSEFIKQRWIETTYKRLWHLGFNGHVGGFTWPTAQSAEQFANSEIVGWQSGAKLNELLVDLKHRGYRVHMLGHSLGNVVAAEALHLWRESGHTDALVKTYVASQAAIPAAVYNPLAETMPDVEKVPFTVLPRATLPPDVYARYWKTGDSNRLPETWADSNPSYSAKAFIQPAASRWVNFYNRNDYALSWLWEIGNRLKPAQMANFLTGHLFSQYDYTSADGFARESGSFVSALPLVWQKVSSAPLRFPEDRYELFSFAAPAWSLALGTIPTGGAFTSSTNLAGAPHGFGNEHLWHSGQFRSYYAVRWRYWNQLLIDSQLKSPE